MRNKYYLVYSNAWPALITEPWQPGSKNSDGYVGVLGTKVLPDGVQYNWIVRMNSDAGKCEPTANGSRSIIKDL